MIIGINSYQSGGKDTVAKFLIQRQESFEENNDIPKDKCAFFTNQKFAGTLKVITAYLLGKLPQEIETREFKDGVVEGWDQWSAFSDFIGEYSYFGSQEEAERMVNSGFYQPPVSHIQMTGRDMLIGIGVGLREKLHPDVWIKTLLNRYTPDQNWIISDLRYPNEFNEIKKLGGYCIRIEREGIKPAATDTLLDDYVKQGKFDLVVYNNGTIEELQDTLDISLPENLLDLKE